MTISNRSASAVVIDFGKSRISEVMYIESEHPTEVESFIRNRPSQMTYLARCGQRESVAKSWIAYTTFIIVPDSNIRE
jgi:hypothetical protein